MAAPAPGDAPASSAAPAADEAPKEGDEDKGESSKAAEAAAPEGSTRLIMFGVLAVCTVLAIAVIGVVLISDNDDSKSSTKEGENTKEGESTKEGENTTAGPELCPFSYDGKKGPTPDKWGELTCLKENMCGKGNAQSPITLPAIEDKHVSSGDLKMEGYGGQTKDFDVDVDTGPAINVVLKEGTLPYLTKKSIFGDGKFYLKDFQFHLGSDDTKGAEHQITGVTGLAAELQFVHLKEGKNTLDEALSEPGSTVVLSVLYKAADKKADVKADAALNSIIEKIGVTGDASKALVLSDLIGPLKKYFVYTGSITTPPCTQGIKWVVFDTHPVVKSASLKRLRDMSPKLPKDNFRPARPSAAIYNVKKFNA